MALALLAEPLENAECKKQRREAQLKSLKRADHALSYTVGLAPQTHGDASRNYFLSHWFGLGFWCLNSVPNEIGRSHDQSSPGVQSAQLDLHYAPLGARFRDCFGVLVHSEQVPFSPSNFGMTLVLEKEANIGSIGPHLAGASGKMPKILLFVSCLCHVMISSCLSVHLLFNDSFSLGFKFFQIILFLIQASSLK